VIRGRADRDENHDVAEIAAKEKPKYAAGDRRAWSGAPV
jgi:hypothetical protein